MSFLVPGPVTVAWTRNGGSLKQVGALKDGVRITIRTSWTPISDDMHGGSPATYIFSGKGATVELIGLDSASLGKLHWIGGLLNYDATNFAEIGQTIYNDIGGTLTITETRSTKTWVADKAALIDPTIISLLSTQEVMAPFAFFIVPNSAGKLFSTIPDYLT
jgi:hypothetical protein